MQTAPIHPTYSTSLSTTSPASYRASAPHPSCPRCGAFAPELDEVYAVCPPCVERVLPEGCRDAPSFVGVWRGVVHVLRTDGLRVAGVALAIATPGALLLALVPTSSWRLVDQLYGLATIFASIVVMLLGRAALLGRRIELADALGEAFSAYPRVLWARIVAGFYAGLWGLLLVVPGIYMGVRYSLAGPVALFGEERGDAAVQRSSERMVGRVAIGFGGQLLVGALWMGAAVALLLGAVFVSPPGAMEAGTAMPWLGAFWTWIGGLPSALGALGSVVLHEQIVVLERTKDHALSAELRAAREARDAAAAAALAARRAAAERAVVTG